MGERGHWAALPRIGGRAAPGGRARLLPGLRAPSERGAARSCCTSRRTCLIEDICSGLRSFVGRPEIMGRFGSGLGETEAGDGPGLGETGPAFAMRRT